MYLYRIVKSEKRTSDLSGTGAFQTGGRWNNKGTYMLYTSENSSLAYLENIVHFDELFTPPNLFMIKLEIHFEESEIYTLPESLYPQDWKIPENIQNKKIGDTFIRDQQFAILKVRSAVNPLEYNYLLNPLFREFHNKVKILSADRIETDARLIKK